MKRVRLSHKILVGAGAVAFIAIAAIGLYGLAQAWTGYEWYRSMGQQNVFFVRLYSQFGTWLACSAVAFVILQATASSARMAAGTRSPDHKIVLVGSALLACASGVTMSAQWTTLRMAFARTPFGIVDPQFGHDVGYFVFTLPAIEAVHSWLLGVIALAVIWALAIMFVPGRTELSEGSGIDWARAKQLVFLLTGLLLLAASFGYRLSILQLGYSSTDQIAGATYADVHARIPSYWILTGLTAMTALVFVSTARSKRWRLPVSALALWVVSAIVLGNVWPAVIQDYVVAPNEASLELPYIERTISMTRTAFKLESSEATVFPALTSLSPEAAASAQDELRDARLWTPESVKEAYTQIQTVRPYYSLSPISVDRYMVDGTYSEVLVAAREVNPAALPDTARTWVNQHLVYTHGFGLAVSSASATTPQGFPLSLVGGVPPAVAATVASVSPDLMTEQPRIYFGSETRQYAIVNTAIDEFDYPVGEQNKTYRHDVAVGARLGAFLSRAAWAVRLRSDQILFSGYLTPESRILAYRDIKTRVSMLAPWLTLEDDAYPALVDGSIMWIIDGYTSSDHFPYSQQVDGVNYLRNSVKVTVDAYSGETHFYAVGDDPIREAWSDVYPALITPESAIPTSVAAHFRYPKRMFETQAALYPVFHMTDPTVFYNKEDQWANAGEQTGALSGASYMMLDLPNATSGNGLYMVQTFTPYGKDNVVGWLAVACDSADYGAQVMYLMPKDHITLGPNQVMAMIEQDPVISPQLTLWDQRGSQVIFGEMLTLPVQGSVAYIQPVFIKAKGASITQLVAVIVVAGDSIEMAPTLSEALARAYE